MDESSFKQVRQALENYTNNVNKKFLVNGTITDINETNPSKMLYTLD